MSELDLGGAAPAPTTLTPPAGALVLAPPAPVPVIQQEQAAGMLPVPAETLTLLQEKAGAFAADLVTVDPRSPEFARKVESISSMGAAEIAASASVSNRMLERPAAALASTRNGAGGDATARVAKTLLELRTTVTELDPARADLSGARKILKFLPGGDKLTRYFARYQSAQSQLDAIIRALASGQDELRKDNAAIEVERATMWTTMGKLSEYATLAQALDDAVERTILQFQTNGEVEKANQVQSDALFPLRQRRQDILTQLAVSAQGYLALDLVKKNNVELIKGVDRAQNTTISALRTAVIVAQALANQKLVLDQINALNTTTSNMIQSTSEMLKQQGAAINEQASSTTISLQSLQVAFDNVFATMDAIDTYRAQAVVSMGTTVSALEQQIERSRPYLERSHQGQVEA
ncbi:MAG TPA: toxic anion resistance protein [Mycobacteriales bacterium]|jgi:uncharacterized protein YaaN involved in tellurite resistance|nr:toxic anion resistance protein [Mycobacteriales bacterium]